MDLAVKNISLTAAFNIDYIYGADKGAIEIIQSSIILFWTSSKIDILSQVRIGQLSDIF